MKLLEITDTQDSRAIKVRGERLKEVRAMARLKQVELAEAADLSVATIRLWETGKHGGLTRKGAAKVARALISFHINCSVDWLLGISEESPQMIEDPLSGKKITLNSALEKLESELNYFLSLHTPALYVTIQDEAMLPMHSKGDYVAGPEFLEMKDLALLQGEICIIETPQHGTLVRVVADIFADTITLIALNPSTATQNKFLSQIKWSKIAPVVWIRKSIPKRG